MVGGPAVRVPRGALLLQAASRLNISRPENNSDLIIVLSPFTLQFHPVMGLPVPFRMDW
jgi:hypothetical protein